MRTEIRAKKEEISVPFQKMQNVVKDFDIIWKMPKKLVNVSKKYQKQKPFKLNNEFFFKKGHCCKNRF